MYRLRYQLHSLVHLPQQLVTECTDQYRLYSLVYLLQQPVAEFTDQYRLYSLVHLLQQLVTECTDQYWPHSRIHLLVTECTDRLPAKQPCTVTSTTGYSVPTGYTVLYSSFNSWLQCTVRVPATQPCTVCQLVTECTDWLQAAQSALNSLLHITQLQALLPITNQH